MDAERKKEEGHMPTVLITGANSGIGLEFARQYAARGWAVIAANRSPFKPADYAQLGYDATEIRYDAQDDKKAAELALRLKGRPIDVVILNAGISEETEAAPEEVTAESFERSMMVNTYAPLHLAALLEDNLKMGEAKLLVGVSSLAADTGRYDVPRQFAYRASKAALNQMWRNLAVEWKDWGCTCITLRPGRVRTRMTGYAGDLSVEQAVSGMIGVLDRATPEDNGAFIWHGTELA
tara:strand:+ start:18388 stop:19098 length:711 start_codon:yes stop_codon:yes gene_type:complete